MAGGVANVTSDFVNGDLVFYDKSRNEISRFDGTNRLFVSNIALLRSLYRRCTVAEINAGLTLLSAVPGYKYRMVDVTLIAIGGNAGASTAVTISGTQAAGAAVLISALIAALTRSTVVKPNTANVSVLADGASFILNDANTGITIEKTGSTLTTSTHVDVILSYTLEAA